MCTFWAREAKGRQRNAAGRRAAPAASAEGASIVGRAPQARGCSITRRGEPPKSVAGAEFQNALTLSMLTLFGAIFFFGPKLSSAGQFLYYCPIDFASRTHQKQKSLF
jgi:hypothetical protein